jgi:hypothetical protein
MQGPRRDFAARPIPPRITLWFALTTARKRFQFEQNE